MDGYAKFLHTMRNAKGAPVAGQRARLKKMYFTTLWNLTSLANWGKVNFVTCAKSHKPCELSKINFVTIRNLASLVSLRNWISQPMRNLVRLAKQSTEEPIEKQFSQALRNFAWHVKSFYVIFRYFYTDSVRFLSSVFLCKYPNFSL